MILNQPYNGSLGDKIIDNLNSLNPKYDNFTIISAFAKTSGVYRLKKHIDSFRKSGGTVTAYVGIDALGTSYEALVSLFNLCNSLYVCHSNGLSQTYHPKIYSFSCSTHRWLAIGSNNLTGGGLWSNFESSYIGDSSQKGFNASWRDYQNILFCYSKLTQNVIKISSLTDIDKLEKAGLIKHEYALILSRNSKTKTQNLFGNSLPFNLPPLPKKNTPNTNTTTSTSSKNIASTTNKGILWCKTGPLTGGSRNQLDLSTLGTVIFGNAFGTIFYLSGSTKIKGNCEFFGINYKKASGNKIITLCFNNEDYSDIRIVPRPKSHGKHHTWQIRLAGKNSANTPFTRAQGANWLSNKFIFFKEISTDYYEVWVVDETPQTTKKVHNASIFYAYNGNSPKNREFGLIM